jgi:hypothetical protein
MGIQKEVIDKIITRRFIVHDFLRESIDTCKNFLQEVFSKTFWKNAVSAVLIAAFTKAVKAFLETAIKVSLGIARDLLGKLFKYHKYDDEGGFSGFGDESFGFDSDFDAHFQGDFGDYEGMDIKQRNLRELEVKAGRKVRNQPPPKPAAAKVHRDIDDIGIGKERSYTNAEIFDEGTVIDTTAEDRSGDTSDTSDGGFDAFTTDIMNALSET